MMPPIFITGVPRSGTTLVSMMLNAHSIIRIAPETHYFTKYYRKGARRDCLATETKYREFVQYVLSGSEFDVFEFSEAEKRDIFNEIIHQPPSHAVVLSTLLRYYAEKHGKAVWGDKSPEHMRTLRIIFDQFPDAKIIHVVRDPRDVILSLRKVKWYEGNMLSTIRSWKQSSIIAYENSKIHPDNFYVTRYEDVLSKPEVEISNICSFLGVEFETDMINYHQSTEPIFDVDKHPWKVKNLEPIDANNKNKWVRAMSSYECEIVEKFLGPHLDRWGYRRTGEDADMKTAFMLAYLLVENLVLSTQIKVKSAYLRVRSSY